jgi:hypothetical protein
VVLLLLKLATVLAATRLGVGRRVGFDLAANVTHLLYRQVRAGSRAEARASKGGREGGGSPLCAAPGQVLVFIAAPVFPMVTGLMTLVFFILVNAGAYFVLSVLPPPRRSFPFGASGLLFKQAGRGRPAGGPCNGGLCWR